MKTLEQAIALNAAYRNNWRGYLAALTRAQIAEKLALLTAGFDHESKDLCQRQIELIPHLLPHPLLRQVFVSETLKRDLLPAKTVAALTKAGFFGALQAELDRLQRDLGLPEEPLPELLLHSGLKYIHKEARALIRGKAIIDGGAYIGDTAKLFCDHYDPCCVYAIEPEQSAFDTLSGLVAQWHLADRIVPLRHILGEKPGQKTLWGTGVGASVIKKIGGGGLASDVVEMTSVDAIVAAQKIPAVGMIKLDIEGNELAAVRGAIDTIRRDRPLLLISIYHTAQDFFEVKPLIQELNLDYRFIVRKITDDLMKELILIGLPDGKGG